MVGSKVCLQFLANLVHKPFNQLLVKNEDTLDLGGAPGPRPRRPQSTWQKFRVFGETAVMTQVGRAAPR